MSFNIIHRNKIISDLQSNINDNGSHKVQVIFLTYRILKLQKHVSIYKKDFHSKKGLLRLVFQRRRILKYIKLHNIDQYYFLTKKLKLRS